MGRKCSHCGLIGHNSRTCCATYKATAGGANVNNVNGFKLFGVQLQLVDVDSLNYSSSLSTGYMKKSVSLDWLGGLSYSGSANNSSSSSSMLARSSSSAANVINNGYLSDGNLFDRSQQERKKGVAWTEEEHKRFLRGLEKQGKGDWRGISRNYVKTRTPTQVASHAQKYFLRRHQSSLQLVDNKKRRSSLFDLPQLKNRKDDDEEQVDKKRSRRDDYKDEVVDDDDKDSNNNQQRAGLHYCSPPDNEHLVDFLTTTTSSTQRQTRSLFPEYLHCFKSITTTTSPAAAATKTITMDNNNKGGGGGHEVVLTLSMEATPADTIIGQDIPSPPHASSFLLAPPITV